MTQNQFLFFIFMLAYQYHVLLAQLPCQEQLGHHFENQSIQLSMAGKRNQTGHWVTRLLFNKASTTPFDNWKVDFQQSTSEFGGVHNVQILGILTVPPKIPEGYELFPGIGYYKFHTMNKVAFGEASLTCTKEGGHLAIINSNEEASIIKALYTRHGISGLNSYAGIYDPNKNRNFVTIFGQSLNHTGYAKWISGQPNGPNTQFCVYVNSDGLLGDVECSTKKPFFCEYDLSWSET